MSRSKHEKIYEHDGKHHIQYIDIPILPILAWVELEPSDKPVNPPEWSPQSATFLQYCWNEMTMYRKNVCQNHSTSCKNKYMSIWDYHESRSINISTTFNHHSGCKGSCFDTHIHHAPWWFKISTARIPREKVGSMFLLKANLLQVCNSKKLDEHPPPFWCSEGPRMVF